MIMSSSSLINCKIINTMAEWGIKLDFKSLIPRNVIHQNSNIEFTTRLSIGTTKR